MRTDFGFRRVDAKEKIKLVSNLFSSVANSYDLMNDIMSGGMHRCWKDTFIKRMALASETKLLDVAGGTGDIAQRFLAATDAKSSVHVVDLCENMIKIGKTKLKMYPPERLKWSQGNAENLVEIADSSYDIYSIAFGIRNCADIDKVLNEAYRVLKPGGRIMVLEFSKVENPVFASIYNTYLFRVIPHLGLMIARDRDSYQYLAESIERFPNQQEIVSKLKSAGFSVNEPGFENLLNGVVAIWSGWKIV